MTTIADHELVQSATTNPKYDIPPEVWRHAKPDIVPPDFPDYTVYGLPADAIMHDLPDLDFTKPVTKPKKKKKKSPPPPPDPTFWWANTEMWSPRTWQCEAQSDGIHFWGATHRASSDRYWGSFGITSLFGLDPERVPNPGGQWWRSTPHVELFGELHGGSDARGLFDTDGWAKCSLYLTQELYQIPAFGPDDPLVVGKATSEQVLINNLSNSFAGQDAYLQGFTWMPPVTFNRANFMPTWTLWAKLTVNFAFYLRSGSIRSGELFAGGPPDQPILVRGFQWPLTAL